MKNRVFTSESVTEGHPDKICDQISDAVLDAIMAQDPAGRVACETTATTGMVMVMGEITTTAKIDIPPLCATPSTASAMTILPMALMATPARCLRPSTSKALTLHRALTTHMMPVPMRRSVLAIRA